MNKNRLSTKIGRRRYDPEHLRLEIDKLLSRGSNYEIRENNRKFITNFFKKKFWYEAINTKIRLILKNESGNILLSFNSQAECAKYLGISPSTVAKIRIKKLSFTHHNKLVYLFEEVENIE